LLLVLTAASSSNAQQTTEPTFVFDTGQPAWRGERIELPPGFARDLGWNGVEQIRFAPGMFKAEADDFFSYVLVFLLEPGSDVSETGLTRELLTYFKGLSTAVMKGKKQTVDTTAFSFTIDKADQVESAPASAKGVTAYTGILDWVEPFATQKKQLLNFEVHTWEHNGQAVVLSCVSPLERDQALWTELREIRSKFHFEP
tara:strand:+ start:1156 stop:1755 length:600 start_codon:yes stop_codon:yes gene_type:complete